jgi:hypothetical protein
MGLVVVPDPSDCYLVRDLLDHGLGNNVFEALRREVDWGSMNHRGNEVPRLVAVQGEVGEDARSAFCIRGITS